MMRTVSWNQMESALATKVVRATVLPTGSLHQHASLGFALPY